MPEFLGHLSTILDGFANNLGIAGVRILPLLPVAIANALRPCCLGKRSIHIQNEGWWTDAARFDCSPHAACEGLLSMVQLCLNRHRL